METVLGLAFAMGRTLVLPPAKEFYLLKKRTAQQRSHFSFQHFFHMEQIHQEHAGLNIITMQEYLEREHFRYVTTGAVAFPPGNRTQWDGASDIAQLFEWLRSVSHVTMWNPDECVAAFPASPEHADVTELRRLEQVLTQEEEKVRWEDYIGHPVDVDAPALDRLKENWAERQRLCIYDESMQAARHVHFPTGRGARLLVHFYAMLFFQDWKQDLWMKRFIRDPVRPG